MISKNLRKRIELLPVLDLYWPEEMQKTWWIWYGQLWDEFRTTKKPGKGRALNSK